ncbi:RusA family crossover junction endodeoxyribonuclease [Streptomyces pseudogriseolus]|uniref:RusA family crossover junction endodeoxyribonuclease n=1 Tax=Streptomyces pseudogriseolus TaxID=36817 RepID=UPI003FA2EB82
MPTQATRRSASTASRGKSRFHVHVNPLTPAPRELLIVIPDHNPAPQGSKEYKGHYTDAATGKRLPRLVESSKRHGPWREAAARHTIRCRAAVGNPPPMDGVIQADVIFTMAPPQNVPADPAKRMAMYPNTRHYGDIDKLLRSTYDALQEGGAILEDSRIVRTVVAQLFPWHPGAQDKPGAAVRLVRLDMPAEDPPA